MGTSGGSANGVTVAISTIVDVSISSERQNLWRQDMTSLSNGRQNRVQICKEVMHGRCNGPPAHPCRHCAAMQAMSTHSKNLQTCQP